MNPRKPHPRSRQRGAAALVVVMLLFFVISLVAAYASRNLIFEQKASANQYRASQAFEAADAGLEWALAMLNGGRIDASCAASANLADNSFRERYLSLDPATGNYDVDQPLLRPSCVRTDAGWTCSCPASGNPVLAAPSGTGMYPAFRLRFERITLPGGLYQPGVVRVYSTGCTRLDNACLDSGVGSAGETASRLSVVVALASGLVTPPSAALTVRGNMNTGGAAITLRNTDPLTNGITASVGGAANIPGAQLFTVPGSPPAASVFDNDTSLTGLNANQMFTTLFRLGKEAYRQQPGTVRLDDCATACSAKLLAAAQTHPGRMIWVDGDLTIESDLVLGSAAEPVLIVATGNIGVDAAAVQINGLIYSQAGNWSNGGLGAVTVRGAAVAEGNFTGNGIPTIQYDPAILKLLSVGTGSLVRVPGSWRDF
jgi:PilX N-terminal